MLRTQYVRFSVALWIAFGGLMVLGTATLSAARIEDNFDGPDLNTNIWQTSEDKDNISLVDGAVRLYSPSGGQGKLSLAEPLPNAEYALQFDIRPEAEHWSGYAMTIQHEQGGGKPHYWYIEFMGGARIGGMSVFRTLHGKWRSMRGGSLRAVSKGLDPFKTWYRVGIWNNNDVVHIQITARDTGEFIYETSFRHDLGEPGTLSFSPRGRAPIGLAVKIDDFILATGPDMSAIKGRVVSPETLAWPTKPPEDWVTYHLAHPSLDPGEPGDPNAGFFYKGRYHLHYIYKSAGGTSYAHVSSKDMVHWRWHPTTLTPQTMGHGMYSGTGFFTKEGKVAMAYWGVGSGQNWLTYAQDDSLEIWSKPEAIIPRDKDQKEVEILHRDPDCWLNGDTYYAISGFGNPPLLKSSDLKHWTYLGPLLHDEYPSDLGVPREEDISCANMFKIGNPSTGRGEGKWMLLCLSHRAAGPSGCRYYLGDFKDEKYLPEFHGRMSWLGGFHFAPESLLTEDGRRVMWIWLRGRIAPSSVQSLPRELELPEDGVLRIKPLRELTTLRYAEKSNRALTVPSNKTHHLDGVSGDALELKVVFTSPAATQVGLDVLCDEKGEGGMRIAVISETKMLKVGSVNAPFELKEDEDLTLRVFIDKNLVEVFANDRQAVAHVQGPYKSANTSVRLFAQGGDVEVAKVTAWKMKSIYEGDSTWRNQ